MDRRPKGYIGLNHQTIGSDILAVVKALHAPERALGPELAAKLQTVTADGWYPIGLLLDALEAMDQNLGTYALKNVGWKLFQLTHAEALEASGSSARDVVYGIDQMYHHANRGVGIGGWKVLTFEPGHAQLEKTTPHHCVMEEGILEEALRTLGVKAQVTQTSCFRKGDAVCLYEIRSPITDERWSGPAR